MARCFSAAGRRVLTLETAGTNLTWDVFVSHTTDDDRLADEVAECIQRHGLTAWVDSHHLAREDDGPAMASKIKRVIERSYCLLAVVTGATSRSWWVPFEIGVASDRNRFLSTYGDPRVSLPSFLAAWPRVRDHGELHSWCNEIKRTKDRYGSSTYKGFVETAGLRTSDYAREMRAMVGKFPGVR